VHPLVNKPVVLSGQDGSDAKPYQEKDVVNVLAEIEQSEEDKGE